MNWISWIGPSAAIVTCFQFLPQVKHSWGQRSDRAALDGISLPTFSIVILGASLWVAYGATKSDFVIVIPNAICLAAILFTVSIVLRARRHPTAPVTAETASGDA